MPYRRRNVPRPQLSDVAISNELPVPPLPLQQVVTDPRHLLTVPWAQLLQGIMQVVAAADYLEGTHADRIDEASDPGGFRLGTVWYETDRNVFYQVRIVATPPDTELKPTWVYTGGTMWATVDPDERPGDLARPDTGFTFRGIDQARTFVWAGSSWVETTSVYYGPHEDRPAADTMALGVTYIETDRGNITYENQDGAWVYISGTMRAALAGKPADLETNDTGFLFYGIDYAHTWRWDGDGWEFAPGDRVSGEIAWFTADPGVGWHLCDGTHQWVSQSDGSLPVDTALPNLIGAYAKGATTYTGTVVPATAGSISGETETEASHTHNIAHDHPGASTGPGNTSVQATAGGTNFYSSEQMHTHTFDVPAYSGSSGPGAAHSHGAGTLSVSGAEPKHVDLMPYFRL